MVPHTEEIIWARTEDGLEQTGLVIRPETNRHDTPILWIHGRTGSFYERQAVIIGRLLAGSGYTFVSGNNRGHNVGNALGWDENGLRLGGAAWERLDESPYDVAAWMDVAAGYGGGDVVLLGHSLGARKVVYYQAERQDERVRGLIAASPAARFRPPDPVMLREAEEMIAAGRSQELVWRDPFGGPFPTSHATYRSYLETVGDVFGMSVPDGPVSRIRNPLLAFYGTDEAALGGEEVLERIRRNATASPSVETRLIPGADHVYTGCEAEVADLLAGWSARLP
jgi:dienelactone hydrolase